MQLQCVYLLIICGKLYFEVEFIKNKNKKNKKMFPFQSTESVLKKAGVCLQILFVTFGFLIFSSNLPARALTTGDLTITLTTSPSLVVDSNSCGTQTGPLAAYVGFRISNNRNFTINNLSATISGLNTAGGMNLGGGQPATILIGNMAAGQSQAAYWFITYVNSCSGSVTSNLTVTVSNGSPGNLTGTGTITTYSSISAAAGGQIISASLGNSTAIVGQTMTFDATYSFGNVQSGYTFSFQPAGNASFNAGCLQLVSTVVLSSMVTAVPVNSVDQMFFTATGNQGGTDKLVTVRYNFRYRCDGIATVANPYSYQNSGSNNIKYTGNFGLGINFPSAINAFSITKTASATNLPNGGNVEFTITVTNTASATAVLEKIVDTLPVGATFVSIESGSDITAANSSSVPSNGASGIVEFVGQPLTNYSVAANSSIRLIYRANLPNTPGIYTNQASAVVGNSQTSTASASVSVGSTDLGITSSYNNPAVRGQITSFDLVVTNFGSVSENGLITVTETLPVGLSFNSFSGSGWSCSASVQIVTCTRTGLASNASATVTITANVLESATTTLSNSATVTGTLADSVTSNNTTTGQINVVSGVLAGNDSDSTLQDTPVTVNILNNDSNIGAGSFLISSVGSASNGSLLLNPDNTVTYTPNQGYFGSDSFVYTIINSDGQTSTATVTITVNQNQPPVANNDSFSLNEDSQITYNIAANDTDNENRLNTESISIQTQPVHGTVTLLSVGDINYQPNADYYGSDSFTYTICDQDGNCSAPANVSITVNPINDIPVGVSDDAVVDEDSQVDIAVLGNDTDTDNDTLSICPDSITAAANGSTLLLFNGSIRYEPYPNYYGQDSFTYQVCDGNGGASEPVTVNINVNSINDVPTGNPDSEVVEVNTSVEIFVLANDTDEDGDELTFCENSLFGGVHGSIALSANGVLYSPDYNYIGNDSFIYRVCDGESESDNITVTIDILPVNEAPVASPDSATTNEDENVLIDVLANDEDSNNDTLTFCEGSISFPQNGNAVIENGKILYTPNPNFNGQDSFTYRACDMLESSETVTVTVTVNPINDVPFNASFGMYLQEDQVIYWDVINPMYNVDGDTEFVCTDSLIQPEHGTISLENGLIKYTPEPNFVGTVYFQYKICDETSESIEATVTLFITPLNDDPIGQADFAEVDEGSAIILDILANDSDPDADVLSLCADSVVTSSNGTAEIILPDNQIIYVPNIGFVGQDSFTYKACDDNGGQSQTITVNITVNNINFSPEANDDSYSTQEDQSITINPLENDFDLDNDELAVCQPLIKEPEHGNINFLENGQLVYTPEVNFYGIDSIEYRACDSETSSNIATITINISSSNDNPVGVDDNYDIMEDNQFVLDVLSNDIDPDNDELVICEDSLSLPMHGFVTIENSRIRYTPNPDYHGEDAFTYHLCDDQGGQSDPVAVTLTIYPVNDSPVAMPDEIEMQAGSALIFDPLINDSDIEDDAFSLQSINDTTVNNWITVNNALVLINEDGTLTIIPDPGFVGSITFDYRIIDADQLTSSSTVTVNVQDMGENQSQVNLGIDIDGDKINVAIGQEQILTITQDNFGPDAAVNSRINFNVPDGYQITLINCIALNGAVCPLDMNSFTASGYAIVPYLPSGSSIEIIINGNVVVDLQLVYNVETLPATNQTDVDMSDNRASFPTIFDPPRGKKVGRYLGNDIVEWTMVWINESNQTSTLVRIEDEIKPNMNYIPDSLICEARGSSIVSSCEYFAESRTIRLDAIFGPDQGNPTEDLAQNEVLITFRHTVPPDLSDLSNQAMAYWDENGDGRIDVFDNNFRNGLPYLSFDTDDSVVAEPTVLIINREQEKILNPLIRTGGGNENSIILLSMAMLMVIFLATLATPQSNKG